MSKTRSLHHIVFCTKNREMVIPEEHKKKLYAYLYGILQNKKCFLHRMNGIPNHIHILVDVHPTIALADLLKELKQSSSVWLKGNPSFPYFCGWGRGYYAVSLGVDGIEDCKNYIINQEDHHITQDMRDEMEYLQRKNGLSWYEDDWM